MVHALEEIRHILKPDGVMIDLRPLSECWIVELVAGQTPKRIGRMKTLPAGLADDEAANNAIQEGARRGWFQLESEKRFPFNYYWDTPQEMLEYTQERWGEDYIQIEKPTYSALLDAWTKAGGNCHVRLKVKMHLARWRKQ